MTPRTPTSNIRRSPSPYDPHTRLQADIHMIGAAEKTTQRGPRAAPRNKIREEKNHGGPLPRGAQQPSGVRLPSAARFRGAWRAHSPPNLKQRTALLRQLKNIFGRNQSQLVRRVMKIIKPVLRGLVNYVAVGPSGECISFVKDGEEKGNKQIKRPRQHP